MFSVDQLIRWLFFQHYCSTVYTVYYILNKYIVYYFPNFAGVSSLLTSSSLLKHKFVLTRHLFAEEFMLAKLPFGPAQCL